MIVGKLMVMLGLDKTGFDTGLNSATNKTTLFKKATDKTFAAIKKSIKMAFVASAIIVAKGVADWKKYEAELANVSTMLDKETLPMMKEFEKGMLSMSQEFGESTATLSKGLYDILSASIPASEAMDVLRVSTMAAKAGVTDTGVAADALTTLMNSFADSTKDADYYADILFSAVKFGKTTFGELADSVGNVATLMATAGGSAEEMAGMLSILTRSGIDTRVATTSLKGVITSLLKPSEALTEQLDGVTIGADGFAAVMAKVAGLPPTDLAEMFPNVRALQGVVIGAEGLSAEVEKITNLMEEGSPAQIAFQKQTQTLDYSWNQFKATLKATSITIGKEVAPVFKVLFAELTAWFSENQGKIAEFFKGFVDTIKGAVVFIGNFKEIIIGLGVAFATLSVINTATTAMAGFGVATTLSLGPIAAIAAAVGVLVYALIEVNKISKDYQTAQENMANALDHSATSVEEYDAGITAAGASLDLLKIKQEQNIATLKTMRGITAADIEVQKSQDKIAIASREAEMALMEKNKKDFIYWAEREEEIGKEKAQAEMQNQLDIQASIAKTNADKITAAALDDAQLKQYQAIQDELAYSRMTIEERYNFEIKKLEELGISTKDATDYMKIQFADLYEEVTGESDDGIEEIIDSTAKLEKSQNALWAAFGKGGTQAWEVIIEKTKEGVEEEKTLLEEFKEFIVSDLYTAIYDGIGSIVTAGLDLFNSIMDAQVTAVEDKYAAQTDAEIAYQAFLDGEAIKDKQEQKDKLEDLKERLEKETDLDKKAELEKQISALETSILKQQLDDDAKASRVKAEADAAAEILVIKQKQFKVDKALRMSMAIIDTASAVIRALVDPGGVAGAVLAVTAGILGGISIAKIASEPMPMVSGGGVDIENSGVFSGKAGIDTNNVALTSGEYVMPVQQTRDNYDELEAMRSGESGNSITIVPAPVELFLDSEKIGEGMIQFMTTESDLGTFRLNPKIMGEV